MFCSNCDHSQKIVLYLIILPEFFFSQSYHLSITKLLILLVVIIFPLLQLCYCFLSAFYRFNCIETVKCIKKNLNFSYRYLIFYISGKKRKRDREFKGPIAHRYICTLFCPCFTLDIGLIICHWVQSFIIPYGHHWSTASQ